MTDKQEEVIEPKTAVLNILKDIADAPDMGQIEKWKQTYGDVFVSGFSEQEIFLFRPLNRAEHTDIQVRQQIVQLKAQKANEKLQGVGSDPSPSQWEEIEQAVREEQEIIRDSDTELVLKCLLWPKLTVEDLSKKAGTIPVLVEQIMSNSNFIAPNQANALVIKL